MTLSTIHQSIDEGYEFAVEYGYHRDRYLTSL